MQARRARLQALLARADCNLIRYSEAFPDAGVLLAELRTPRPHPTLTLPGGKIADGLPLGFRIVGGKWKKRWFCAPATPSSGLPTGINAVRLSTRFGAADPCERAGSWFTSSLRTPYRIAASQRARIRPLWVRGRSRTLFIECSPRVSSAPKFCQLLLHQRDRRGGHITISLEQDREIPCARTAS
jgi:hypothetical protein